MFLTRISHYTVVSNIMVNTKVIYTADWAYKSNVNFGAHSEMANAKTIASSGVLLTGFSAIARDAINIRFNAWISLSQLHVLSIIVASQQSVNLLLLL